MERVEYEMELIKLCFAVPGKLESLQTRADKLVRIKVDMQSADMHSDYDRMITLACRLQFELDQLQAYTNELFGVICKLESAAKDNLNEPWVTHVLHAASQMTNKIEYVSSLMDAVQVVMDRVVKNQADEDCYQQA